MTCSQLVCVDSPIPSYEKFVLVERQKGINLVIFIQEYLCLLRSKNIDS